MNKQSAPPTLTSLTLPLSHPPNAQDPPEKNSRDIETLQKLLEPGTSVNNLSESKTELINSSNSRSGRKNKSLNYSGLDVTTSLRIIEEVKPIGLNQWATLAKQYIKYEIDKNRIP